MEDVLIGLIGSFVSRTDNKNLNELGPILDNL